MSDLIPPDPAPLTIAQHDEQRFRVRRSFERAFLAHLLAYPLAFLTACAAIPLSIHLFITTIDGLGDDLGPAFKIGLEYLITHPDPATYAKVLRNAATRAASRPAGPAPMTSTRCGRAAGA